MRRLFALVPLFLAISACGGGYERGDAPRDSADGSVSNSMGEATDAAAPAPMSPSAEQRSAAGPSISPTAAPGVAFNYRYAFRLAADRIAAVQEQHAARCEALGVNRCRITGMLYRRHDDQNIEARLSFKLDPSIARIFGREAVGMVTQAEGMLVENEISGTDVGPTIRRAGRSIGEMREELARLEARLRGRIGAGEKSDLEYQVQQLRASISAAEQNRAEAQESLATTPMTFAYGSGHLVPGPQPRRPLGESLGDAWDNFLDGASVLFVLLVTLLPWILLGLAIFLLVRWIRRRFFRRADTAETPLAPPADGGTPASTP
jgi:Sec-independent protein translocase protein TatA